MSRINSSHHMIWKKLIELALFDDSYPQRINASFHFLCPDAEINTFTLKDLIHRGSSILLYLNLDVDKDSNFAVMDLFRLFDRSGRGHVVMEDFVLGVVEKLHALMEDTNTLQSIATSMLLAESRCIELATLLEKGSNAEQFHKFNIHLKAHSHPIRTRIRALKTKENMSAIDRETLVHVFRDTLQQSILDTQHYFHVSANRMTKLLAALPAPPAHLLDADHDLSNNSSSSVNNSSGTKAPVMPARTLWRLVTPSTSRPGTYALNQPLDTPSAHSSSTSVEHLLSGLQGTNTANSANSGGNGGSHGSSNSSAEEALAQLLSGKADMHHSANHLPHLHSHMNSNHLHNNHLGATSFAHLLGGGGRGGGAGGGSGGGPEDLPHLLDNLLDDLQTFVPLNCDSLLLNPLATSSSHLHTLQDALLALNNFFQLKAFAPPEQHQDGQLQLGFEPISLEGNYFMSSRDNSSSSNAGRGKGGGRGGGAGGGSAHMHTQKVAEDQMHAALASKIQAYRTYLQTSDKSSSGAPVPVSTQAGAGGSEGVLEGVLAEELFRTQETLTRTQTRLRILELLQQDVVTEEGLALHMHRRGSGGSGRGGADEGEEGDEGLEDEAEEGGAEEDAEEDFEVEDEAEDEDSSRRRQRQRRQQRRARQRQQALDALETSDESSEVSQQLMMHFQQHFAIHQHLHHQQQRQLQLQREQEQEQEAVDMQLEVQQSQVPNRRQRNTLYQAEGEEIRDHGSAAIEVEGEGAQGGASPQPRRIGGQRRRALHARGGATIEDLAIAASSTLPPVFPPAPTTTEEMLALIPYASTPQDTSFERILYELSLLGAALAERGSTDYPLGLLLETPALVLDANVKSDAATDTTANNSNSSAPGTTAANAAATSSSSKPSKESTKATSKSASNNATGTTTTATSTNGSTTVQSLLSSMDILTRDLLDELRRKQDTTATKDSLVQELKQREGVIAEHRAQTEQADFERNEFLALSVEMQVLREKAQKIAKDEHTLKLMEARNSDLTRRVRDLEDLLQQKTNSSRSSNNNASGSNAAHSSSNAGSSANSNGVSMNGGMNSNSVELQRLKDQIVELNKKHEAKANEAEAAGKENARLKAAAKVSEQRVKSALQDQMTLHHQIQALEEENMSYKTTITKLTRELEEQRALRNFKEDAERRIFELQKDNAKKEVEFAEAKETALLANKYHNDLIIAERAIETLEQKVAEYGVELEKGYVAVNQLENYREQLRMKTKEMRDLSLHIHGLESQLKDVSYLQHRVQELGEELQDTKIKGEKIPGLLAEIARLRGGTRASIKALAEQDKLLSHLKTRVKQLEKENALLKNDNRALQDVELKLKEAHSEVKRLMTVVAEVQALKVGVRNAEEEKKSMEGQYKKMRKFMNQTVLINQNNNNNSSSSNNISNGAEGGEHH